MLLTGCYGGVVGMSDDVNLPGDGGAPRMDRGGRVRPAGHGAAAVISGTTCVPWQELHP